jgi:hypothetical protein
MNDRHVQRPNWQERQGPRGGNEYWRPGPGESILSVSQPHGDCWRMYINGCPLVRSHADRGIFPSAFSAMDALDALAADDMQDALLD